MLSLINYIIWLTHLSLRQHMYHKSCTAPFAITATEYTVNDCVSPWLQKQAFPVIIQFFISMQRNNSDIYIIKVKYFLSLHFNDHFTGGPGIDGARMSAFWILLQLRMIEVTVTTGAVRRANLQSNYHQQPTPSFFTGQMRFLLPNQQRQSTTHIALLCTGSNYEQQYWITQTH